MSSPWVPLHVHSQYSILDASAPVNEIASRAVSFGMPAVALTDHGNLYGAVDFFKACKAVKVKPIIGCELYVAPGSRFDRSKDVNGKVAYHLVVLAKDDEGYHNLCKLSSIGFLEGFYYHPRVDKEVLKQHSKGLICLSACLSSSVAAMALHGTKEQFLDEVRFFHDIFGNDYFLELQRQEMLPEEIQEDRMGDEPWLLQNYYDFIEKQKKVNNLLLEAAQELSIPFVATNDSHYIERHHWRAHEVLLNIGSGESCEIWERDSLGNPKSCVPNPKRRTYATHSVHFRSGEEMAKIFADLPLALANSLEIAKRCNVEIDFKSKHYPIYVPPGYENKKLKGKAQEKAAAEHLQKLCEKGIERRYTQERLAKVAEQYVGQDPLEVVRKRLAYEAEIIISKGMCDYLLIVYDFINWAKEKGIPMGPGRGSGAGSIICYLIGITDIEPLRFNLLFERFINPQRLSYPDIDVDICMSRRGEVIDYTVGKYGKDNVAQIITFGTMKAKMAIRDVGRVLSVPLTKVNEIAKLVPEDPQITLDQALETDPDLYKTYVEDKEAKRIIDFAKQLEGSIRNTGIHAAGMIICADPILNHIPVCTAKDSQMAVTQFSMKPVELVGMLKIDFLGLKTLTSIQKAVDAIKMHHGVSIPWIDLPLDDPKTFALINQGKTLGVFQIETGGMQELAKQLHLDRFEEVIAVLSLYRPGPMDMIPSFIARKFGKEVIENDHPWMEEILRETYGIMVYQEQVMQIAQKLAGYTLGEGDVLRRAMGKKDKEEMAKQRAKFVEGASKNGIDEAKAIRIFDKIEKFASYGFNKSHAAAYGYLTYVTAFLKAHYPKEWMAALMTCDHDDLTKVAKFVRECEALHIAILPPDVNEADFEFVATDQGIRFAMTGIKGIGEGVVEAIIEERKRGGPFMNFFDFFKRIDQRRVGKKAVENLVDAGSFDFTTWSRDQLRASIDRMHLAAERSQKEVKQGVMTLFSLMGDNEDEEFSKPPSIEVPNSKLDLLIKEKTLLGFFLTGHPLDAYKDILKRLFVTPLHTIEEMEHDTVFRAAFILDTFVVRISHKTRSKFAVAQISDGVDSYEMTIWAQLYEEKVHLLRENQLLYAVLQVDRKDERLRLTCRFLDDLTKVSEETIEACDRAFDLAKGASRGYKPKERKPQESMNKKSNTKKTEPLTMNLHVERARLSHILQLKKIFRENPGESPITIHFHKNGAKVNSLVIEEPWAIEVSVALKKQIRAIDSLEVD